MLEHLSWAELLARWSADLAVHGRGYLDALGVTASRLPDGSPWVGREPAAAQEIAATEARLGMTLPPSVREFYLASNGFPIGVFVSGVRPVGELGWFRDLEPDWYGTWRSLDPEGHEPVDSVHGHRLLARCLLLSTPGDDALLLDPARVDPVTGEWFCLRWWSEGVAEGRPSFRAELEQLYLTFVGFEVPHGPTVEAIDAAVHEEYRRALAGDLSVGTSLRARRTGSWRAHALAAQWEAFEDDTGYPSATMSTMQLWWGHPTVPQHVAVADPVLVEELLPLWVLLHVRRGETLEGELNRAPEVLRPRIVAYRDRFASGEGVVADFGHSPAFADAVARARPLVATAPEAAWGVIREALTHWTPRNRHHLAPVGLLYDRDLAPLFAPPVTGLAGPAPVPAEHRGRAVLATPRGGAGVPGSLIAG